LTSFPLSFESQLDALLEKHWPRLWNLLYRLTGDPDEAEDLCLECFMRLSQSLKRPDPPANVEGWLYRVGTNLGLNALRAAKRRGQYEAAAEEPAAESPAAQTERREARHQVQIVLAEMDPGAAQLLFLHHAGFSYRELAEACGLNPNSVGSLLARAEQNFSKRFKARFGGVM